MRLCTALTAMVTLQGIALSACGDDTLNQQRSDSGVGPVDAGSGGELFFAPGQTYRYRGTLTFRDGVNNESTAIYEVEYAIETVDEQGANSTLGARASGERTFEQNWNSPAGADSWVARVGPADDGETVGPGAVEFALGQAPSAPPILGTLPSNTLFFLDTRQEDALRAEWAELHDGLGPGSVDPDQDPLGRWVLRLSGTDSTMQFYPDGVKLRSIDLAYDPRGFLLEAVEILGDSQQTNLPNGRFELELISEPPQ